MLSRAEVERSALGRDLACLHDAVSAHGGGITALACPAGATPGELAAWEARHLGGRLLPGDLKHLLERTNGLIVRWSAPLLGNRQCPVGELCLLPLDALRRVQVQTGASACTLAPGLVFSEAPSVGTTALVLDHDDKEEEESASTSRARCGVWFRDVSGAWHLLAQSFGDYMRLAMSHLCISRWEYFCTPASLDPAAEQWLRCMAPRRLAIDLEAAEGRETVSKSELADVAIPGTEPWRTRDGVSLAYLDDSATAASTSAAGTPAAAEAAARKQTERPATASTRRSVGSTRPGSAHAWAKRKH